MVWSWFDGFMLVLYVCERVGSNAGCAMAADRERSSARIGSNRVEALQDLTQGFPIQISLPDGETHHHHFNRCLRHNGGPEQEAELIRGYLKPPENKCLTDVEEISSQRACHMRVFGDRDDWEGTTHCSIPLLLHPHRSNTSSTHHPQHRHSSPLENSSNPCHLHYKSRGSSADTSSFSLSSSASSMTSYSASGDSPRVRKAHFQMQFLPTFFSPIKDKGEIPSRRQQNRSGGGAYRITNPILSETTTTSAMADIAVVPCGSASTPPTSFLSNIRQSEQIPSLQEAYNPLSHEHYLPTQEDDPPPVYSDVIGNPSLYRCVSKLERRTNSGKI